MRLLMFLLSSLPFLPSHAPGQSVSVSITIPIEPKYDSVACQITTYQAVPEQCWKDGNITACGCDVSDEKNAGEKRFVALSTDLMTKLKLKCGDTVTLWSEDSCFGSYRLADFCPAKKSVADILVNYKNNEKIGSWNGYILHKSNY